MGMGFAPTWLRQVSPLLHMTTLTTGLPLATVNFSFWILNTLKPHICTRDGLMDYQHRPCWFATRGESTNLYQVGLPKTEVQVQVQVPSTASLVVNLLSDHSAGRATFSHQRLPFTVIHIGLFHLWSLSIPASPRHQPATNRTFSSFPKLMLSCFTDGTGRYGFLHVPQFSLYFLSSVTLLLSLYLFYTLGSKDPEA